MDFIAVQIVVTALMLTAHFLVLVGKRFTGSP